LNTDQELSEIDQEDRDDKHSVSNSTHNLQLMSLYSRESDKNLLHQLTADGHTHPTLPKQAQRKKPQGQNINIPTYDSIDPVESVDVDPNSSLSETIDCQKSTTRSKKEVKDTLKNIFDSLTQSQSNHTQNSHTSATYPRDDLDLKSEDAEKEKDEDENEEEEGLDNHQFDSEASKKMEEVMHLKKQIPDRIKKIDKEVKEENNRLRMLDSKLTTIEHDIISC